MAEVIRISKVDDEFGVEYDVDQVAQKFTISLPDILVRIPATKLMDACGFCAVLNLPFALTISCTEPTRAEELVETWDSGIYDLMWEVRENAIIKWEEGLKDADPLLIRSLQFEALAQAVGGSGRQN